MSNSGDTGYISRAVLSNARVSPRKARLVANLIRGKAVGQALDELAFCDKKTAPLVKKLILSAVANAQDQSDVDVDDLMVKTVMVNEAQKIKRLLPRAQGRATPLIKRNSTIIVELDER